MKCKPRLLGIIMDPYPQPWLQTLTGQTSPEPGVIPVPRQEQGWKVLVVSVETLACLVLATFCAVRIPVGTPHWPCKSLKIRGVSGRAAPAGAVAFGVKHTEGVSVDVLFHGHAEPEAVSGTSTRWPLDEGTVLRFSMSQASSEVNDNKVRSGIPGAGPPQGENILPQCGIRGLQVTVSFYAEGGKPINQAGVFLTGVGESGAPGAHP